MKESEQLLAQHLPALNESLEAKASSPIPPTRVGANDAIYSQEEQ